LGDKDTGVIIEKIEKIPEAERLRIANLVHRALQQMNRQFELITLKQLKCYNKYDNKDQRKLCMAQSAIPHLERIIKIGTPALKVLSKYSVFKQKLTDVIRGKIKVIVSPETLMLTTHWSFINTHVDGARVTKYIYKTFIIPRLLKKMEKEGTSTNVSPS
jgi:hypothetical protein